MTDFSLMPHQETALDLTTDRNRCAYYLDMGLGKTFVGAEKVYLLNNDVNIVVCQKSKIDDWIEHFQEYYPDYSVFDLTKKNQAVRFRELVETDKFYDYDIQIVGVINYDLVEVRNEQCFKKNEKENGETTGRNAGRGGIEKRGNTCSWRDEI